MLERVTQELRRLRRKPMVCHACGLPIRIEQRCVRHHGRVHHEDCVRYKRRRSK